MLATIACLGFCAVSCNGASPESNGAGTSAESSTVAVTAESQQISVSPRTSSPQTSVASSVSSGPIFQGGRQSLTLADARATNDWREGSFNVPSGTEPVKGIAAEVTCYSDPVIEFRFSRQKGNLLVNVAQDLDSKSSSMSVEFTMFADGRSVDVKQIDFASQAQLLTQLDGVSVIKITANSKAATGNCQETTALLTAVQIVSQ